VEEPDRPDASGREETMSRGMTVREAWPEDAPEQAALAGELDYPATTAELARRLALLLEDRDNVVIVADVPNDRALGWTHAVVRRQGYERVKAQYLFRRRLPRG
jgi:hypothetical protein